MSDSESDNESDMSTISDGGLVSTQSKTDSALAYAQQMNKMVESYETFITEMKALSTGSVAGQKGSSFGIGDLNVKNLLETASKGKKEIEVAPSEAGSSSQTHHRSATSTTTLGTNVKCCDCNAFRNEMNKKVDTMCCFLQKLFSHQVQLLGKNYQDQMEMQKKVEEVKVTMEEYDDELEYLETQLAGLRKTNENVNQVLSKLLKTHDTTLLHYRDLVQSIGTSIEELQSVVLMVKNGEVAETSRVSKYPPAFNSHANGAVFVPSPPLSLSGESSKNPVAAPIVGTGSSIMSKHNFQ